MRKTQHLICAVLTLALCLPLPALAEDFAVIEIGSSSVRWDVRVDFESVVLTVTQPNTKVYRKEIRAGEPVGFDLGGAPKDGLYKWQLLGIPRFDASVRDELRRARVKGNECEVIERLREAGLLPQDTAIQSGAFSVRGGVLVPPDLDEGGRLKPPSVSGQSASREGSGGPQIITAADQVIPDDLIVQGSTCVGLDCVNNENFSFDTIRLKENNLRIHFDDTSTSAGFPANDWRLIANDSASGGQSKFSIEDSTAARTPFTVEAGASTNSLYIDSTGRVGLRTSTPVLDLHINTSNTPAIRLEQNNSGGFTAQTWDIGANEANFFVRDVTGGSLLSFRIRPGAPTSSLDIASDGDVGVGTASPSGRLHVRTNEATSTSGKVLIQNTSAAPAAREGLEIQNNGQALFILKDTSQTPRWAIGTLGTNWVVDNQANGGTELTLTSNGNLTVPGTVNGVSDRNMKKDIVPVRREEILEKLARLPIATWTYKSEDDIRHMGPMAQDFSAAFGLGMDDKHIAPTDMAGVTMAAVQALHEEVTAKDAEIAALKQRNDDLAKRLADLEALVSSLAAAQK